MNIKFNISPSSLNQYNESQLVFYYNQIKKAKPDTKTYECYGKGGTAVHEVLDRIAKNPENLKNWQTQFQNLWVESDLHFLKGFNSQPLSQNIYRECVEHGIHLIKNEYKIVDPELNIEIPFKNNSKFKINFKGKIDVVGYKGDKKVVMDYKTSSSMDSDTRSPGEPYSNFQLQGLFYAWLLWKKKGFLVDEVIFEYLKLKKPKSFPIKEEDLIKFEKYLYKKAEEIFSKGSQIECYEIGKINSPWNQHKIKCETEKARRNSKQKLIVERGRDNTCTIMTKIYDSRLIKALREKYSYDAPGSHFSEKFINKVWDGKKYLFQNQKFPFGFWNNIQKFLEEFNKHFGTNYCLELHEPHVINNIRNVEYNTKFKELEIKPRYYQYDAKDVGLKEKIGILYLGTSGGKTIISAMLIRDINKRILFVVNRIELVRQTKKEFEKLLGVEIGELSEGNCEVDKQITVASIQTINAILERGDETTKKLSLYLYNVNGIIYDEAQTLSNSSKTVTKKDPKTGENKKKKINNLSMYSKLMKKLTNCEYFLGLSGSPHRRTVHEKIYANGRVEDRKTNNTLEMNAIVGFVVYTKTTKELEKEGYITPTKCYFIDLQGCNPNFGIDYHDYYVKNIIHNENRNDIILKLVENFRNKKKNLVLTKRIEHGKLLSGLIDDSFYINGTTSKKKRKQNFEEFKENRGKVLVGSTQIFSTGIDIPDLDIVYYSGSGKSDIEVIQTVGRVKRKSPGKKFGYLIDFLDSNLDYFNEAALIRKEILEVYGNEVKVVKWKDIINEVE